MDLVVKYMPSPEDIKAAKATDVATKAEKEINS